MSTIPWEYKSTFFFLCVYIYLYFSTTQPAKNPTKFFFFSLTQIIRTKNMMKQNVYFVLLLLVSMIISSQASSRFLVNNLQGNYMNIFHNYIYIYFPYLIKFRCLELFSICVDDT